MILMIFNFFFLFSSYFLHIFLIFHKFLIIFPLENDEIIDILKKLSEETQIEDVNGVNANEMRKKNKMMLHCPEDFFFDPICTELSSTENAQGVAFYKYLASEIGKNEDFNYHKYQLLKSHVYIS